MLYETSNSGEYLPFMLPPYLHIESMSISNDKLHGENCIINNSN